MKKLLFTLALTIVSLAGNAQEEIHLSCPDENHPHAIDMGGVKIACCNVGAAKPEDYGYYYAWGETETKSIFTQDTYSLGWWDTTLEDYGYKFFYYYEFGERNLSLRQISGTQYDVAHVKWGGCWRMSKSTEGLPIGNMYDYTEKWVTYKGTKGLVVTSNETGNSIFYPAAGRCDSILRYVGEECLYWCGYASWGFRPSDYDLAHAPVHLVYPHNVYYVHTYIYNLGYPREYGLPVRPFYDETLDVCHTFRDGVTSKYSIYNLYGIKVADKASNINALPPGIYIVNGKKFVVK